MKTIVEYIWVGYEPRSKTRVLEMTTSPTVDSVPHWKCSEGNTEVVIKPRVVIHNPLTSGTFLALCDTYNIDGTPVATNTRFAAAEAFNNQPENEPWFGLEQEYTMCKSDMPTNVQRTIAEEHLTACLEAGINMSGCKASSEPRQWEFQVGPCVGIEAGDNLHLARFLLERIAEKHNVLISYEQNGCCTNFSTRKMREADGIEEIYKCMERLAKTHAKHLECYGTNNISVNEHFSVGVGTRNTSVRIPNQTFIDKFGHFEDRRPAANMDPYAVTSMVYKTCCIHF